MSLNILDSSFHEDLEQDAAAELLSLLTPPDSIKSQPGICLGSPQSYAYLLYRYPQLLLDVKDAMSSRNFDNVWETCLEIIRDEEYDPEFSGPNRLPDILESISSSLEKLVKGDARHPLWTLQLTAMSDVAILDWDTLFIKPKIPPMLFNNLDGFWEDPILKARVQDLFQTNVDTFFMNASGTGKTRLLYEGLCQNWGFYFTSGINLGEAKTLHMTLDSGILEEDAITKELPKRSALSFDFTLARNREILYRRFALVLLAHLLVFRDFLKMASALYGSADDNHRKRWLIAQLSPFCLDPDHDSFLAVLRSLEWVSSALVKARLTETLEEIRPLLPGSIKENGFFIVIDEANVAHTEFWQAHPDDVEEYPALRELITAWKEQMNSLDVPLTFIVAGTDIPTRYFPSSDTKWSSWRWTSNTGSFDLPEKQKEYFHSFFPSSLLDTPSGDALVKRVQDWCGTRHRFTATPVQILLEDKLLHPHGSLNWSIKRFTEYQPHDADEFIALEGS
ncbi:hypothetical protein H0H92_006317, partial [Tricholoma furcatifolium]